MVKRFRRRPVRKFKRRQFKKSITSRQEPIIHSRVRPMNRYRMSQMVSALARGATNKRLLIASGFPSLSIIKTNANVIVPSTVLMNTFLMDSPCDNISPVAVGVGTRVSNNLQATSYHCRFNIYQDPGSTAVLNSFVTVRLLLVWIKEMLGAPGVANSSAYPSYEDMFDVPTIAGMTSAYLCAPKSWENNRNYKFLYDKQWTFSPCGAGNDVTTGGGILAVDGQIDVDLKGLGPTKYNTSAGLGPGTVSEGNLCLFLLCDNSRLNNAAPPILDFASRFYYITG